MQLHPVFLLLCGKEAYPSSGMQNSFVILTFHKLRFFGMPHQVFQESVPERQPDSHQYFWKMAPEEHICNKLYNPVFTNDMPSVSNVYSKFASCGEIIL